MPGEPARSSSSTPPYVVRTQVANAKPKVGSPSVSSSGRTSLSGLSSSGRVSRQFRRSVTVASSPT